MKHILPYIIATVTVVTGLVLFYWFQIRPALVVRNCHNSSVIKSKESFKIDVTDPEIIKNTDGRYRKDDYEFFYKTCLRENGLNW